eukprot:288806-Chlamydomonas_euryale.AAC.1
MGSVKVMLGRAPTMMRMGTIARKLGVVREGDDSDETESVSLLPPPPPPPRVEERENAANRFAEAELQAQLQRAALMAALANGGVPPAPSGRFAPPTAPQR